MPVISTDVAASNQAYAVRYDSTPETIIVEDDVLVYLYTPDVRGAVIVDEGFDRAKLYNYGHVIADGASAAVRFTADRCSLYNAVGADITGETTVLRFEGEYGILKNAGRIVGSYGAATFSDGGNLSNSGTIEGYVDATLKSSDFFMKNTGSMSGGVTLNLNSANSSTHVMYVQNSGDIGGGINVYRTAGVGTFLLQNDGEVTGDIGLSNLADVCDNRGGHIIGDVGLGGGADSFDNRGGRVDGTVSGGAGDDTFTVDATPLSIVELAGGGNDTIRAATVSLDLARYAGIENITLLGGLNLAATGNAGANVLFSNEGVNILKGLAGDDTYYVQNAGDQVVEAAGGGLDTVHANVSYVLPADVEILVLDGDAAIDGTGNAGANFIVGNGAVNRLSGGAGNDTYVVDNAGDLVIERADSGSAKYGIDTVRANVSYALGAGQAIERFEAYPASAAVNLTGNAFAQTLTGNAGANRLDGREGSDRLTGSTGKDTFVFSTALGPSNLDHITDFSAKDDTIKLFKTVFDALAPGQLAASAFKDLGVSGAKVDADDRIVYDHRTGSLAYDADGSGKGAAVTFAFLDDKVAITAADFFVLAP